MVQERYFFSLIYYFVKLHINVNKFVIVNLPYDLSFSLTGLKKRPYATGLPVGPARDTYSLRSAVISGGNLMGVYDPSRV